jgi:4-amino-4-deoxychorismate lyase
VALSAAIWVDGEPASSLPLPDRGLDFGDGLFETLLLRRGQPLFEALHFERLQAGLQTLGFPDCLQQARDQLALAAAQLAEHPWTALRLTVTRGEAPRGYAPPEAANPRIVMSAAALNHDRSLFPDAIKLGWAELRWSSQPLLAGLKHLNRLEQVMAAREAAAQGLDEVVVLNQTGSVCSVSSANLFVVAAGTLYTPALETSGISGTRRRLVLERWAPEAGLAVEQAPIAPEQLERADELFICNSIRGIVPVATLGGRQWHEFPVSRALHTRYCESLPC